MSTLITNNVLDLDGNVLLAKGQAAKYVNSLHDLLAANMESHKVVNVLNYHTGLEGGGGVFYWDASKPKTEHNGGTVIDPAKVFPTDWNNQTQLTNWFTAGSSGTGCWVRQYDGAVNVKWFGAKDGQNGDKSLLAASDVAIAKNCELHITCDIEYTEAFQLKSNLKMIGFGNKLIRQSNARFITPSIDSSLETITAVENVGNGQNYIVLDEASYNGLNVGDYIQAVTKLGVGSDIALYESATTDELLDITNPIYQKHTAKIVEKLDGNIIVLDDPFSWNFDVTVAGTLKKLTIPPVENVLIDGIHFVNGSGVTIVTPEDALINLYYVYNLTISNCIFDLSAKTGGIYISWGSVNLLNCTFINSLQLSVYFRAGVVNSNIDKCHFKNHKSSDSSLFIQAFCKNINVTNNSFGGSLITRGATDLKLIAAIDLSARCKDINIIGNSIEGFATGVRLLFGCFNINITGNTIKECVLQTFLVYNSKAVVISNNNVHNGCNVIATSGDVYYDSNTYTCSVDKCENISILDNIFTSTTSQYTFSLAGNKNVFSGNTVTNSLANKIVGGSNLISNNTIESTATTSTPLISIGTGHYNSVVNNSIRNTNSRTFGIIALVDGSECNTIIDNTLGTSNSFSVYIHGTSKAQSIHNNIVINNSVSASFSFCNVTIDGPVVPTNAILPRGFRIYEILPVPYVHGINVWEFSIFLAGQGYKWTRKTFTSTYIDL